MYKEVLHIFNDSDDLISQKSDIFASLAPFEERLIGDQELSSIPLPGVAPLEILMSKSKKPKNRLCEISFENVLIGHVEINPAEGILDGHEVSLMISDNIPESVLPSISYRLRSVVSQINDYRDERMKKERRAENSLAEIMGPANGGSIKVTSTVSKEDLIEFLFPGALQTALNERFSYDWKRIFDRNQWVLSFTYEEEGVEIPAFRLAVGRKKNIEIWGRGKWEHARTQFITDLISDYISDKNRVLKSEDFRMSCDELPPARKNYFSAQRFDTIYSLFDHDGLGETHEFGNGFSVRVEWEEDQATDNGFLIYHRGMPLAHSKHGHAKGVKTDDLRKMMKAAFLTLCDNEPNYMASSCDNQNKHLIHERLTEVEMRDPELNEDDIKDRILEAFGFQL